MGLDCSHSTAYPSLNHRTGSYCPECDRGVYPSSRLPVFRAGDFVAVSGDSQTWRVVDDSHPANYVLQSGSDPGKTRRCAEKFLIAAQILESQPETVDIPMLTEDIYALLPMEGDSSLLSSVSTLISSVNAEESSVSAFGHDLKVIPSHGKRYFRYVAWEGHKVVRSLHIPGGNTHNGVARERAYRVRQAIRAGKGLQEIEAMIVSWRTSRAKRR